MKTVLATIVIFFLLAACSNDDNTPIETNAACGVDNPTAQLTWLRTEIERREQDGGSALRYCYILQGELAGATVFVYEDCNPLVNKIIPILDCEGVQLNNQENPIGLNTIENRKIIWKTSDFACNVNL